MARIDPAHLLILARHVLQDDVRDSLPDLGDQRPRLRHVGLLEEAKLTLRRSGVDELDRSHVYFPAPDLETSEPPDFAFHLPLLRLAANVNPELQRLLLRFAGQAAGRRYRRPDVLLDEARQLCRRGL